MNSVEWARLALGWFDGLVQGDAGMRLRPGQRLMAETVARTFSEADLGKPPEDEDGPIEELEPVRSIAVIQAGTGVGKTLAYSVPAVAMALARNTRVMISTATVALQEQLVHKDLPALSANLPQPFKFALAKGRGRYVCRLKLDRWVAGAEPGDEGWDAEDDLFGQELAVPGSGKSQGQTRQLEKAERVAFYQNLSQKLEHGDWNGDRDTLTPTPEPTWWSSIAAEASSCTARHCPAYGQCSYYEQRKALVGAQVIVVNHDLLLSSMGSRLLPDLDNCLLVLDEAHHLPATALEQFACSMDLSRLAWIDKLASMAMRTGGLLAVEEVADIPKHAAAVRKFMQDLERLAMHHHGTHLRGDGGPGNRGRRAWNAGNAVSGVSGRFRLPRGETHSDLVEPLAQLAHHAHGFLEGLRAVSKALRAEMRDHPDEARKLSQLYAQLGSLAPRLEAVHDTVQWWMRDASEGEAAVAKWFTLDTVGDYMVLQAHASPILPGTALRQHLWSAARAVVLTSATLTSAGRFDFFLKEVGLQGNPVVTALEVPSPFDFAAQGRLVMSPTHADPKDAEFFTAEMVQALLRDLGEVRHGALVLFTSQAQLRAAEAALSDELRSRVLLQTAGSRSQLLKIHRQRVEAKEPSIIFGMQSFGEGLDLPGKLCEDLFITKLPFAPPDDPVGEARAEWLRALGRDPFMELVVPATAIRLAQWVGRAIRTEEDRAHVTCYDRRLTQTRYGQLLLRTLPPLSRVELTLT